MLPPSYNGKTRRPGGRESARRCAEQRTRAVVDGDDGLDTGVPLRPDGEKMSTVSQTSQEEAPAEVAAKVLGIRVRRASGADDMTMIHRNGRLAAFAEATLGEREDMRRGPGLWWPAPGRWWWRVTLVDVRRLPRLREIFPIAARACEASGVARPGQLPAAVTMAVPDLHWLVHTVPAHLVGDPSMLDRPTTVTLGRGRYPNPGMANVGAAVDTWLAEEPVRRALSRLHRRRTAERHLYLTIGCTAQTADAFESLVRGSGVPPAPPARRPDVSHLWLAPVLGRSVFLWSREDGWSRYEPYD